MPGEARRWPRPRRPLQDGRRKGLSFLLLLAILFLLGGQTLLDAIVAVEYYRDQKATDAALADAPVRFVRVRITDSPPEPGGGGSSILVDHLPTHCGVGDSFNVTGFAENWCVYALVDVYRLGRGFGRCADGGIAGTLCSEGMVPVRERGGRYSLGDRTGARSYLRLAWAILLSDLFMIAVAMPTALLLGVGIPGLMLNLIYGRPDF
jgi:hypothetical protein